MRLNKEAIAMFTAIIFSLFVCVSKEALFSDNAARPPSSSPSRVIDSLVEYFQSDNQKSNSSLMCLSMKPQAMSVIGGSSVECGESTLFYPLLRDNRSMFPYSHFLGSSFLFVSVLILFLFCLGVRVYNPSSFYSESKTLVPKVELSLNDLLQDLIPAIFNCLKPKELGIVSCVSATWYKIASDNHVRKDFFGDRLGLSIPRALNLGLADDKTWKEFFVEREFIRRKIFTGQYKVTPLPGHKGAVRTVFLLVSEKLIFTAGYESVVRVWKLENRCFVASSWPLDCTIRAITADTKLLLAGGNCFIQCWNAVNRASTLFDLKRCQSYKLRLCKHEGPVTSLALDFTRIYSGSWDMTVRVWDRTSLECLTVLKHRDQILGLAPNSQTIASMSRSNVYIWNNTTNRSNRTHAATIRHCHEGYNSALARSHTGDFLFTGGEDGAIHMFDISNFSEEDGIFKVATWVTHSGPVNSLAYEFPWLVSASKDGMVSLIDVRKFFKIKSRRSFIRRQSTIESPQRMLPGSKKSMFSVCIGRNHIVSGGDDGIVKVWDFPQEVEKLTRQRRLRNALDTEKESDQWRSKWCLIL